ncbi:hypothetical protein [uncultured Gammaproteobacteria bacterium]|nr:hypothetical protein [uncultured Gammaproteobacteria bacterium]
MCICNAVTDKGIQHHQKVIILLTIQRVALLADNYAKTFIK